MTIKLSTGARNLLCSTAGFSTIFNDGIIEIYTGAQPATADTAVSGTLLGRVTVGAGSFTPGSPTNGLGYDAPVAGVVSKAAAETWQFVGLADGTAGWFRLKGNATDAGSSSTTLARMDGSIASSGGDMNLANLAITTSSPNTVDSFTFTVPAQ